MIKKKIFISFDIAHDRALKNEIVAQSQMDGANFKISNWSMAPKEIDAKWIKEAKFRIKKCDALAVLTGENTHQAEGVKKEIEIAAAADVKIIQLLSHPQITPVEPAGTPHDWSAETLKELLK